MKPARFPGNREQRTTVAGPSLCMYQPMHGEFDSCVLLLHGWTKMRTRPVGLQHKH